MINLTNHFIVAGVALSIGFVTGYRCADKSAQIEQLEKDSLAYQQEIKNLQNVLDKEHKWNDEAETQAEQTAQNVENAKQTFSSALNSINSIIDSLHESDSLEQPAKVPYSASVAGESAKCSNAKCNCKNTEAFRKLSQELLIISKDCDIQNSYLKQCVGLYNSIRN